MSIIYYTCLQESREILQWPRSCGGGFTIRIGIQTTTSSCTSSTSYTNEKAPEFLEIICSMCQDSVSVDTETRENVRLGSETIVARNNSRIPQA